MDRFSPERTIGKFDPCSERANLFMRDVNHGSGRIWAGVTDTGGANGIERVLRRLSADGFDMSVVATAKGRKLVTKP